MTTGIFPSQIRTAIIEVMDGDLNSQNVIRFVEPDLFAWHALEGKTIQAIQSLATQDATSRYRFDVLFKRLAQHPASAMSAKSNKQLKTLDITIDVVRHIHTSAEDADRLHERLGVERDLDIAIRALAYPNNLDDTVATADTGIVSGCLVGPGGSGHPFYEITDEDNDDHLIRAQILASAILDVSQPINEPA